MSVALWPLLGCGLLFAAEAEKPAPVRYLRPEGDRYVLESEVTTTATAEGTTYVSRTERGPLRMTLTVHADRKGRARDAETVLEKDGVRKSGTLDLRVSPARCKRGGITDFFKVPADPVVTTAPDWSDVFALVRRYDGKKGGKQEFAGVWFHPVQPPRTLTFTVERVGSDKVKVGEREEELGRYRVVLRSGRYLAWARADGRVCKILPGGPRAVPVVLEGYEEATRGLK